MSTGEGGIKYHGLSARTGDNPLARARGLSPCTGGQTVVKLCIPQAPYVQYKQVRLRSDCLHAKSYLNNCFTLIS